MNTPPIDEGHTRRIQDAIRQLLRERDAILLAHNYQRPEIQDVADICGDSLELSIRAAQTDARVVVFCGVHFMAETASILCPDKQILLPARDAGCPMADMITAEELRRWKQDHPGVCVVSYVNTTAAVKAESDICCTSANAVPVVQSIETGRPILMTPDRNLARFTQQRTGRDISYWNGYCPFHDRLTPEQVRKVKAAYPEALFLAHPECPPGVTDLADEVTSTSGMIAYVRDSEHTQFIIGTEVGILYPLAKANPDKLFLPADPQMLCRDMKKTDLGAVRRALENLAPEVRVPEDIRQKAKAAVERMLAVPRP